MKKLFPWSSLMLVGLFAQACLVVDNDPDCIGDGCYYDDGDIAFYWDFELDDGEITSSCSLSEVARVDIEVYDDYGDLEFSVYDVPCDSDGVVLTNFYPGNYEIELVAYCRTGQPTHEAWYEIWVDEGMNDYGTFTLDYMGPCI